MMPGIPCNCLALRLVQGRELPPSSCVATPGTNYPDSKLPKRVSQMMTAQVEASAAYQAISIPVSTGRTLTAFAVRIRPLRIFYMTLNLTHIMHRLVLTMVGSGPLLVTAVGSYMHLILPLQKIFCRCRVMCCSIHGPESIALTLWYVHEPFTPNKADLFPFIHSMTHRSLPFVPQAPDGCEHLTLSTSMTKDSTKRRATSFGSTILVHDLPSTR